MLDHAVLLFADILDAAVVLVVGDARRERVSSRGCRAHLTRGSRQVPNFTRQTGHEGVLVRVVLLLLQVQCQLLLRFFFSLAEGVLEELLGATLLHGLLFEDILQQVLVPLDQTLRIDLSVLDLLLSIALDPLKQCLEALLVLLSELLHFSDEGHLKILVHDFSLKLFLLFDHISHSICFVIVLD